MSSLPVNSLQAAEATSIPDERCFAIHPQVAGTIGVACDRLLKILDNTARDSAISKIYPQSAAQLDLVRFACSWLLHVLNSSNAAPHLENQVSGLYPHVILTASQLTFTCAAHSQFLQVCGSLHGGYNVAQLYGYQILRDSAISQVTLIATHVEFILAQLLRICASGMLPGEYHAIQPRDHQLLADNDPRVLSQIEPPVPKTSQLTVIQEAGIPASGGTSSEPTFRCLHEGCTKTFGRIQECKRHHIDVHEPPRRCPFCPQQWTRPDKIKIHLREKHEDKSEVLNEIHELCGQSLVKFLNELQIDLAQNVADTSYGHV